MGSFLSTLSLRRATTDGLFFFRRNIFSIHALLAESDERANSFPHAPPEFSIHALLAESDIGTLRTVSVKNTFLSTLSLRRATSLPQNQHQRKQFSIHALLAESDTARWRKDKYIISFLSTLSLRRATELNSSWISSIKIFYPRSPCGERRCQNILCVVRIFFYPRSPCGERPTDGLFFFRRNIFSIHALLAESDNF